MFHNENLSFQNRHCSIILKVCEEIMYTKFIERTYNQKQFTHHKKITTVYKSFATHLRVICYVALTELLNITCQPTY